MVLNRAIALELLTMDVDGQQSAGVEAGTGFHSRIEGNRRASETPEEFDQRYPKRIQEACTRLCGGEKCDGCRDIKAIEVFIVSVEA